MNIFLVNFSEGSVLAYNRFKQFPTILRHRRIGKQCSCFYCKTLIFVHVLFLLNQAFKTWFDLISHF